MSYRASNIRICRSSLTSSPNVDLVRSIYEEHEVLRRFKRERDEVWEEFLVTSGRMIDAGENVVVIEVLRGRGKGSGVETRSRSASLWTVRDEKGIAMATYHDPHEALKAAGLEG